MRKGSTTWFGDSLVNPELGKVVGLISKYPPPGTDLTPGHFGKIDVLRTASKGWCKLSLRPPGVCPTGRGRI
ncbi:hypothetical protein Acor_24750 [Acrocarpospora corrugata]|uniref:Uncharacterized protein n=1 Tax=Acrocarpospora corrugata TaxID=35763 RepID=A0A5M3VZZ1_9ACTN|nr:hypothetical protein [Acrocarpospora corrugata]GES00411.1 hypothetical protein Acor_24750 [Acrocarpospora corrugata]